MINQAICIDGLVNHLSCPKQCRPNGVQNREVSWFFFVIPSETNHFIEFLVPFVAAHLFIIPFQLSGVTGYYDVYSPRVVEYENDDIQKIYLNAEELTWDQSTNESI